MRDSAFPSREVLRGPARRRDVLGFIAGLAALGMREAAAQTPPAGQSRFGYDNIVARARELSALPYEERTTALPEALARLDFDAYRAIRFRPDRALLASSGSDFRLQLFHLGFLFRRPITVNVIRDGIPVPAPFSPSLFDYGGAPMPGTLPVDLGFAGFRVHYPLNDPKVSDELVSFLGASYFRFLGRGQRYGLSARGLAIGSGTGQEEFPYFREFTVEPPRAGDERITIYAVLDSASTTGAYRFHFYPGAETVADVTVTLFPRRAMNRLGIAPLTSMFFTGENDRRFFDDFRPELHDSDGLLLHSGEGEWIWRPLRNPREVATSSFTTRNLRGFGLMQRDRTFEHYQDLDLAYELRPSYWVEPHNGWGEGQVDLVEIPTSDETNDNIVAYFTPKAELRIGEAFTIGYRIRSLASGDDLHPGAKAINTYQARPKALGSGEQAGPGRRRFIIDFSGGDLSYYLSDPGRVQIVPTATQGAVLRTFLVPNQKTKGFRAAIDVALDPGKSTDLRAFLRAGTRALSETWTFPWIAE